ncbi:MAG TPA: hypothetical protein VIB02_00370 [Candidatus Limnocylindrales bacterium]|jgi:hypothetical protein
MKIAPTGSITPRRPRSPAGSADPASPRVRRRPVRPLDDGSTELVHVIEFVLPAGDAIQPVMFLDRQLLD